MDCHRYAHGTSVASLVDKKHNLIHATISSLTMKVRLRVPCDYERSSGNVGIVWTSWLATKAAYLCFDLPGVLCLLSTQEEGLVRWRQLGSMSSEHLNLLKDVDAGLKNMLEYFSELMRYAYIADDEGNVPSEIRAPRS